MTVTLPRRSRRQPMTASSSSTTTPSCCARCAINLPPAATTSTPPPTAPPRCAAASRNPPDLVILDLGLPDIDGVDVVEGLRGWSTAPIIVLSARHSRSRRRSTPSTPAPTTTSPNPSAWTNSSPASAPRCAAPPPPDSGAPVMTTAAFTIDLAAKRASPRAGEVRLTPTEWHLARNPRPPPRQARHPPTAPPGGLGTQLRDRNQLPARPHRQPAPQARTRPRPPRHLITEPGIGYRFEP